MLTGEWGGLLDVKAGLHLLVPWHHLIRCNVNNQFRVTFWFASCEFIRVEEPVALKHEPENVLVWKPSFSGRTSCVWETNMALRRISGPEGRNSRIVEKKNCIIMRTGFCTLLHLLNLMGWQIMKIRDNSSTQRREDKNVENLRISKMFRSVYW